VTPAPLSPQLPAEAVVSAHIRQVGAAHRDYYEKASALLAYARVGTDLAVLIDRLNATLAAQRVLIAACTSLPESLGLPAGEDFPVVIDIPEEDIHEVEDPEEEPR
jgi:hypothetical protein